MLNRNNISFHIKGVSSLGITLLFLAALFLAGYPSDGGGAGANNNQEPAGTELNLYDSITFDFQLSSSLAAKLPAVTVKLIAPFTVNDIPERIDKWLNAVREYGGKVELKPDPDYPASRNFGLILDLLEKVYDVAKEMLIYSNAENYNVDVLYKPASGEVTKFVFTLKNDVSAQH
jgi:hypothetical protein